ncbi:hypothetical protein A3K73_05225 [Candidatus Pacearchaeota archaeon RBG_13_36_9]|nr:MAG: hypothetical protein A3K73_05225 [Candidatus Pacearchaeota archaeon RBG_13_36_9]HJX50217.1 hypothetical protein [Candidatus Nanoarchaeia archaeon]
MSKVSIFGPRDKMPPEEGIDILASYLSSERDITELATGGVVGFPTELVERIRRINQDIPTCAYTPCSSESEWDTFYQKGIVPRRDLFDKVVWATGDEDIKFRALKRILLLVNNSNLNIAYLGQGNTHLEVLSSLSMGIPTLYLVDDGELGKWQNVYKCLLRKNEYLPEMCTFSYWNLDNSIKRRIL